MNASTTSLVSTSSSSGSLKPNICVQPSPHPHEENYQPRIHCPPKPSSVFHRLHPFKPTKPKQTLRDRGLATQALATELSKREEKVRLREEMVEKREWRLKAGFFELAQKKVREACDGAAGKEEKGGWRGWRKGRGWKRWEEGRFG